MDSRGMKTGRRALAEKLREESMCYKRSALSTVCLGIVVFLLLVLLGAWFGL